MKSSILAAILAAIALAFGPSGSPTLAFAATQALAPDRTVVVESFDGAELTGGAVTNDGLSAMLIDALLAAGGYTVLEKGVAGAKPRFLIKGSIVRFDANAGSAAVQMGGVPGVARSLGAAARRRMSRVAVSLAGNRSQRWLHPGHPATSGDKLALDRQHLHSLSNCFHYDFILRNSRGTSAGYANWRPQTGPLRRPGEAALCRHPTPILRLKMPRQAFRGDAFAEEWLNPALQAGIRDQPWLGGQP